MNPQRLHVIYEPNADGTYTAYTVMSAGCTPVPGIPGAAPMMPHAHAIAPYPVRGPGMMPQAVGAPAPGAVDIGGSGSGAACRLDAGRGAAMQPLGSASTKISTDHGAFPIDDPRLLFVVIARKDAEGKKVSKQAAEAIVKALGLKSSKKSRGQFVRKPDGSISQGCLDNFWYFRFTTLDKHDAEAPKLTFCVSGVEKMGGCRVYVIAQDMSKRAAHGKYKDVAPLQATGAPKATK